MNKNGKNDRNIQVASRAIFPRQKKLGFLNTTLSPLQKLKVIRVNFS